MPLRATFKTAKNTAKINHESTRMDTNKNKAVDILLKGSLINYKTFSINVFGILLAM